MEEQKQTLINLKIKTLNNSLYEIRANLNEPIFLLQKNIQNKIGVPQNSQRILFCGLMLDPNKCLKEYKIQQGHILQLIANKIPSEISSVQSSTQRGHTVHNTTYTQQQLKSKRHRYLQQRLNGFKINKKESLEVLNQSKHTIDQLMSCLNFNIQNQVFPFRMERRNLEVGQWVDVKDGSEQWAQGQIINNYGQYALVHFNGCADRWNQWIPVQSERIMPFRTFTVQSQNSPYLSAFPSFDRKIGTIANQKFECSIDTFVNELTTTIDGISKLIKDLQFDEKSQKDLSLKNVSNISIGLPYQGIKIPLIDVENDKRQELEAPSKYQHDNLSNKCQDNISNKEDNDDISNKSFKSKRSEGVFDTSSMKSLIVDQQTRKQNKIFFDCTQAQSVCSRKNKNKDRYQYLNNQEYILEQEDSQYNDQEPEERETIQKMILQRKMKASQLAPLMDRMGRLLVDLSPHLALAGHTEQHGEGLQNQNLSTLTHQGSLESKLINVQRRNSEEHSQINSPHYCQFQIPVMLTPYEINRLNVFLEEEARQVIR